VFGDTIVMKAGGEPLIDQGVPDGYRRLYGISACGDNRVRWRTEQLVKNASDPGYALGAPTMSKGITYVTTSTGHVIAIGDPSRDVVPTFGCSNPYFGVEDCPPSSQLVQIAPILADVPLPDSQDAASLRIEPVIANGKLYVGTNCSDGLECRGFSGHLYALEPAALPPGQTFEITVGMTETQTGPDICVRGTAFTAGGIAQMSYSNIPRRPAPASGGSQRINPDRTFNHVDFSQDRSSVQDCSDSEAQQDVVVQAVDVGTGRSTNMRVPAAYWCGNIPVATNYNGGCN
jgi:hypothetical protein